MTIEQRARELLGDVIGYDLRRSLDTDSMTVTIDDALTAISAALSARASAGEGGIPGWSFERVDMGRGDERHISAPSGNATTVSADSHRLESRILFELADAMHTAAAPQPATAQGGMAFAFMAEVCDAAVQAMQANGLIKRTIRLQEVRDQLRMLAAAPQPHPELPSAQGWLDSHCAVATTEWMRGWDAARAALAAAAPQPQEAACQHKRSFGAPWRCAKCGHRYDDDSSPSAQGEGVAWHTDDHLTDKSATTYDKAVAERWVAKGWPVTPMYYTRPTPEAQEARDCTCPSGDGSLRWPCPKHPPVDANVAAVQRKLGNRSVVGLRKYGVSTERGDLSHTDWLRHLQEELMDATVYVEAALALPAQGEGING